MDKLSQLISEAKPLYKTRKRRRIIATTLCLIAIPMFTFTLFATLYLEGNSICASLDDKTYQSEFLQDDFGLLGLN